LIGHSKRKSTVGKTEEEGGEEITTTGSLGSTLKKKRKRGRRLFVSWGERRMPCSKVWEIREKGGKKGNDSVLKRKSKKEGGGKREKRYMPGGRGKRAAPRHRERGGKGKRKGKEVRSQPKRPNCEFMEGKSGHRSRRGGGKKSANNDVCGGKGTTFVIREVTIMEKEKGGRRLITEKGGRRFYHQPLLVGGKKERGSWWESRGKGSFNFQAGRVSLQSGKKGEASQMGGRVSFCWRERKRVFALFAWGPKKRFSSEGESVRKRPSRRRGGKTAYRAKKREFP